MTGQLLARAIVEGRATLNDEVTKYLDEPYPNLENDGEPVRLLHLANMTSQLMDNIPDVTPGAHRAGRAADHHANASAAGLHAQGIPAPAAHGEAAPRARRATPAHSNVASMLLGVVLEKIYGEPFDDHPVARDRKAAAHGQRHGAAHQTTGARILERQATRCRHSRRATHYASASLRYSTEDLLNYAVLAAGGTRCVGEARASAHLDDAGQALVAWRFYWIIEESPAGRRLQFSGSTYGFASLVRPVPGREGRGGLAVEQGRGRRAGVPARVVREDCQLAAPVARRRRRCR